MSLLDALLLDPVRIDVWVANRAGQNIAGSGTQADPYDGSTATKFDALMRNMAVNTCVHLGPGEFETEGYHDNIAQGHGWQAQAGMRIVGSGIDVTKLKLVSPASSGQRAYAVAHQLSSSTVDFFELSDLTINCNWSGQSNGVAAGAVRIMGNHSRVVRVKVMNWGVKTGGPAGFVIAMLTGDPGNGVNGVTNCGIEECIAVAGDLGESPVGPVTVLHVGGKEDAVSPPEGYGLGPYIRNCFVDCGQTTDLSKDFRALSMAWCKGGVVEGNQVHNTRHGGPYQQTTHAYGLTVRGNVYRNVNKGPVLGGLGSSQGSGTLARAGRVVTVSLGAAHALSVGDYVVINTSPATVFDGLVVTVTGTTSTTFTFNTSITSASSANVSSVKKVFGVRDLLIESNTIELPTATSGELIGIHVQDWSTTAPDATYPTYVFGKVAVRGNRIRYVDGAFDTAYTGYGLQLNGAQNLLVSENVVEAVPANPVRHNRCSAVRYLENRTPAGLLIRGYDGITGVLASELETDAEDAFILGLIKRQ